MAPVPDGVGMRLRKRFALPSTVGSDLGGAAVVRVPLVGIDGGQVRLSAVAPDLAPVALAPRVAELARRDGVQWQEVPLSVAPRDGVVEVEIVPVNGRFSVVFDRYRDYGRTQIVKPTGETEAAGAEACLELVLVKP
jgi:hypothetical protein